MKAGKLQPRVGQLPRLLLQQPREQRPSRCSLHRRQLFAREEPLQLLGFRLTALLPVDSFQGASRGRGALLLEPLCAAGAVADLRGGGKVVEVGRALQAKRVQLFVFFLVADTAGEAGQALDNEILVNYTEEKDTGGYGTVSYDALKR